MTDFLKIELPDICKSDFAFENLIHSSSNRFGSSYYEIEIGFKKLKIKHNEKTGLLTIEGSIPFFWQGHNFFFSDSQLFEAIDFLSEIIGLNLIDSWVKAFEFGTVLKVEVPPNYILQNHLSLTGHKKSIHGLKNGQLSGIEFYSQIRNLKIYDVGLRFKQLKFTKEFKETISNFCPNSNFMRLENNVLKPDGYLQTRSLSLKDYCSEVIQERLKNDLMETYQAIQKKGTFRLPDGSKPLKGDEILFLMLAELKPDIKQAFYSKLKGLGLDRETEKNRQDFFRKMVRRIEFIPDERIDLMPLLEKSLGQNSEKTVN